MEVRIGKKHISPGKLIVNGKISPNSTDVEVLLIFKVNINIAMIYPLTLLFDAFPCFLKVGLTQKI